MSFDLQENFLDITRLNAILSSRKNIIKQVFIHKLKKMKLTPHFGEASQNKNHEAKNKMLVIYR